MSRYALGVDIGGTKIAVGAVDAAGAVHARRTIATDAEAGFDAGIARLTGAIDETLAEAGVDVTALAGIGLGCPGPFDEASGRIENFYTLPGWEGNDILSPLVARFDTRVRLINDADAALLGEALAGAARGARVALMLTIGTGIGGAVLIDGVVLRGRSQRASRDRPPDRRPRPGRRVTAAAEADSNPLPPGPHSRARAPSSAMRMPRPSSPPPRLARRPRRPSSNRSADAMEAAVWSLIHSFLPEMILIGGGIGERHFALYREAAERAIARAVLAPAGAIRVVKAALGNDAGMVGAAALMLDDA